MALYWVLLPFVNLCAAIALITPIFIDGKDLLDEQSRKIASFCEVSSPQDLEVLLPNTEAENVVITFQNEWQVSSSLLSHFYAIISYSIFRIDVDLFFNWVYNMERYMYHFQNLHNRSNTWILSGHFSSSPFVHVIFNKCYVFWRLYLQRTLLQHSKGVVKLFWQFQVLLLRLKYFLR